MVSTLEQESSVLELFGLGLGLTQGVKADACFEQDGGAAEGLLGVEGKLHYKHGRNKRQE